MKHTPKIQHAIRFSIKTHEVDQKQKRKGKDIPYIIHPLTVGLILASSGANEDLIIAGILHDTIEDSIETKKVTKKMIVDRFGDNVADLVLSVTEEKNLPWEEVKEKAIEHIKILSHDSLMLKSADIIANNSELCDDFKKKGEDAFKIFGASKKRKLKEQSDLIKAILKKWPEITLKKDLNFILKSLENMEV
jgi:(p)ppGpp synthase/HD superfamily hydrolase